MPPRSGPLATPSTTAWRLLGIGALVVATWWLARQLMPVLVPLVVALLLAALLSPVAERLRRRGLAPAAAALLTMLVLLLAVGIAAVVVFPPFIERVEELGANIEEGVRKVAYSVAQDLAGADRESVDKAIDDAVQGLGESRGDIAGGVLAGATALAQAVGGLLLVLFLCFFVVKDGRSIGAWLVGLTPADRRPEFAEVGERAWAALATYARGVVFVATVDAVFIGLALVIVGVPLVLPLVVLTWFAAFFPIIGAVAAGAAAVLVALVSEGVGAAIAIGIVILLVQQLEGNVLYPAVVGPRVHLHPVAVLLAVTLGATVGGIPGAFLAVPVAVVAAVVIDHWRRDRDAHPGIAIAEP